MTKLVYPPVQTQTYGLRNRGVSVGLLGANLAKIDILRRHVCLRCYTAPAAPTASTYPTAITSAPVAAAPSPLPLLAPLAVVA